MIPLFEHARQLELTVTERELLDYFEKNMAAAAYMNLQDLCRTLYTSSATVVRFCQKLGLGGFNDFKYQLRRELDRTGKTLFQSGDNVRHSLALFQDNLDSIDREKTWQIAQLLTSKRSLYIYGTNLSSLPAKYLQVVLSTLDFPSVLVEWAPLLNRLTDSMGDDAVLVMFTAHGDERYLPVLKQTWERKLTTVLFTSEPKSLLIPYSTICICTNDAQKEYNYIDVNARIGFFTITQILIELVAHIKGVREAEEEDGGNV